MTTQLRSISDDALLESLSEILRRSRRVEVELVAHIGEVDRRELYARAAASSMFAYCTRFLHLSEAEAYLRIGAARTARKHPMLADGRLHLSGIGVLAPHLTEANRDTLLGRATHKSRRGNEKLVAEIAPRPDVAACMRKLPVVSKARAEDVAPRMRTAALRVPEAPGEPPADKAREPAPAAGDGLGQLRSKTVEASSAERVPSSPGPVPERPAVVQPLAPARYAVRFTAGQELHNKLKLRRLQALMRTTVPDGDLATLIEVAVTEKLERLEAKRFGKTKAPRKTLAQVDPTPTSRYIPAPIRRVVHDRDDERCSFVDDQGRRCEERGWLEYHHKKAFGRGGDHSAHEMALSCRTHNRYLAEREYGKAFMDRYRRKPKQAQRTSKPATVHWMADGTFRPPPPGPPAANPPPGRGDAASTAPAASGGGGEARDHGRRSVQDRRATTHTGRGSTGVRDG